MVDLDSNPTKLIEIVEIGKQLLITRGRGLTTFSVGETTRGPSIFAIIPAMFRGGISSIECAERKCIFALPQSAILSAVIFNALIIIALIPLALRGVRYRPTWRGGSAPAQPADLWRGWDHCAIYRYQGHRTYC